MIAGKYYGLRLVLAGTGAAYLNLPNRNGRCLSAPFRHTDAGFLEDLGDVCIDRQPVLRREHAVQTATEDRIYANRIQCLIEVEVAGGLEFRQGEDDFRIFHPGQDAIPIQRRQILV